MTNAPTPPSGGLKTLTGLAGVLAALSVGALSWFTLGLPAAVILAVVAVVVGVLAAASSSRTVTRWVTIVLVVAFVGAVAIGSIGVARIASALGDTTGPADPADAAALASGTRQIQTAATENAFRLVLSESELNAVLQDALASGDNPFRRVTIDITNPVGPPGEIAFEGDFKNGSLGVTGTLRASVDGGTLELELLAVGVGMFSIPGVARSAVEDMIGNLVDLNEALEAEGADVQMIVIGDDQIEVTGTRAGRPLDAEEALSNIRKQVDLRSFAIDLEPQFEPGEVNGVATDGAAYYVALGDSLAANVGVDEPRFGYVSKFHVQLEIRDDRDYGLRNFGVSGETASSLLSGGQLDEAVSFGRSSDVRYVTIDIGANDLLGHLASPDCSEDVNNDPCLARIEGALRSYEVNVAAILDRLETGFPDATVIVLLAYNPFSFGFESQVAFEGQSNTALRRLNIILGEAAIERGFVVADGFTPMLNTATATTHMLDVPPDIHPNELGYDRITGALVAALG